VQDSTFFGNSIALRFLAKLLARETLPSTMLLTGPGGVGKALAGFAFIKALACERAAKHASVVSPVEPRSVLSEAEGQNVPSLTEGLSSCGECAACRALEAGASTDFAGIRPKTAKLTLKTVREEHGSFRDAYLYPRALPYRLFIMEECHAMSEDLANTMLKLLEEPPERTLFILVTDQPSLLLPTILSRSLRVHFRTEPEDALAQWLREDGATATDAENAAYFAQGRAGLARFFLLDKELLPKTTAVMGKASGLVKKEPAAAGMKALSEPMLALADLYHDALLRVESGDVPAEYYLLPWRRPAEAAGDGEPEKMADERKRELRRDALQMALNVLLLTLWRANPQAAATSAPLFGQATNMLDVNLREEQVMDYLLVKMAGAKI
jgi:hypothetical protein